MLPVDVHRRESRCHSSGSAASAAIQARLRPACSRRSDIGGSLGPMSLSNVRRRDHTLGHDPAAKPISGLVALQSRKVIQYLPYASSQYGAGSSRY
jgi:hypothetical protein